RLHVRRGKKHPCLSKQPPSINVTSPSQSHRKLAQFTGNSLIMDYSSLPNDPDHPVGASPWASSPQHNRTTFGNTGTSDMPPSPLPPPAQSPYSSGMDQEHAETEREE